MSTADESDAARRMELLDDMVRKANRYMGVQSSPRKVARGRQQQGKGRMTEKEADREFMKQSMEGLAEETDVVTHLTVQPSIIEFGTMRDYQIEGLNWMINLHRKKMSGILADEMGLGKTLQSISILAYLREFRKIKGKHLILVPLSVLGNWCNELARWCPTIKVLKFYAQKEERKIMIQEQFLPGDWDVVVTSYQMAVIEKSTFRKFNWEYLIVDEAHRLKNENSQLSVVLRTFHTKYRLLLTGTPLQNNLHELWALLNFLMPNLFDDADEFDEVFQTQGGNGDTDDSKLKASMIQKLHALLRPFMLRRLKAEVEKSLPAKKETLIMVGMSALQRKVYQGVLLRDVNSLLGHSKGQSKTRLLNLVMQLRKAANHPYLFDGVEDRTLPPFGNHLIDNCGKMAILDKLLKRLKEQGSRCLIFSQMTRMVDILEDYCIARRWGYCRIDGNTSTEDRDEYMRIYNAPNSEKFIFLLSTRAGGLGINLTTADVVILYDSDWNPQMDLQAQDRAHRIGQTKTVHVFRFVTQNTIEEKVVERAYSKLKLDALVIQQGRLQQKSRAISKDEMMEMISFGADQVFQSKEGSITEEDIDVILRRAEKETADMNSKITQNVSILDQLKLDSNKDDGEKKKLFGSTSWQEDRERLQRLQLMNKISTAMGGMKRERTKRHSYDIDAYYREALREKKVTGSLPRPRKIPNYKDFQFFNMDRLRQLERKEMAHYARYEYHEKPPSLRGLTDKEEAEREQLLKEGFPQMRYADLIRYVNICAQCGRDSTDAVVKAFRSVPSVSMDMDEVRRFHKVFWERVADIQHGAGFLRKVAQGEAKLAHRREMNRFLQSWLGTFRDYADFCQRFEFKIPASLKNRGYAFTEDRFLLWCTYRVGHGEWDTVAQLVWYEPRLRFAYFLKSRTPADIGRRVDALIRLQQKLAGKGAGRKRGRRAAVSTPPVVKKVKV